MSKRNAVSHAAFRENERTANAPCSCRHHEDSVSCKCHLHCDAHPTRDATTDRRGTDVTHRFEREFAHLRGLGFAEALPIEHASARPGIVARLESGRVGVAVEFYEPHAEVAYALVPL